MMPTGGGLPRAAVGAAVDGGQAMRIVIHCWHTDPDTGQERHSILVDGNIYKARYDDRRSAAELARAIFHGIGSACRLVTWNGDSGTQTLIAENNTHWQEQKESNR